MIPKGYLALPWIPGEENASLKVCVIVRAEPDAATGWFVTLRRLSDANVYLGALMDGADRVTEWLEIWVQDTNHLPAYPSTHRSRPANAALDEDWKRRAGILQDLEPESHWVTPGETAHPPSTVLDVSEKRAVFLAQRPGSELAPWVLCQDEAALLEAGLPAYQTSPFRYLYQPSNPDEKRFVSVVEGAPQTGRTVPWTALVDSNSLLAPLNPQGGLTLVRRFAPFALEDYLDLLSGAKWSNVVEGNEAVTFQRPLYQSFSAAERTTVSSGQLFLYASDWPVHCLEILHLKTNLMVDLLHCVREAVNQFRAPLLSLTADSFRVRLGEVSERLPFHWTAKAILAEPSHSTIVTVPDTSVSYHLPPPGRQAGAYAPKTLAEAQQAQGKLRIRTIDIAVEGELSLEGTLIADHDIPCDSGDLVWLRLPVGETHVEVYGHPSSSDVMVEGEVRFRSLPQALDDQIRQQLKATEGTTHKRVPFEVIPQLSTPCDLFSLGVLATRVFLVNDRNTLAIALDELQSLAHAAMPGVDTEEDLVNEIQTLLTQDERWETALGRQRAAYASEDSPQTAGTIPIEIWSELLAAIMRLFPGLGALSHCQHWGDAPTNDLSSVFTTAVNAFERLLVRSRSLILIDWKQNREVNDVIERLTTQER